MTYSEMPPDTPRNRGDYAAPHLSPVSSEEDARTILINRVAWGAVFSGVAMALAVQLVLNLLGIGIGAAAINPLEGDSPSGAALSVGALVWWTFSGIIAAFVGGVTAGRLAGEPRESTAGWHGLTAWAASTLIVALAMTLGMGKIVGGTMNLAGISGAGYAGAQRQNIAPVAGFSDMITRTTGTNANTAGAAVLPGNPADIGAAREKAAQALAQSKGIPMDQARAEIRNDEPGVRQAAGAAAKAVSRGALLAAFALMLGALAAWAGGRAGAVKPTVTSLRLRQEQLH